MTGFEDDRSAPTDGTFRAHIVHAAAADAFAEVDIWNLTDSAAPAALLENVGYGGNAAVELPSGIELVVGFDIDDDGAADATFVFPDNLAGYVGVYAVNDVDGNIFVFAHFEDGTTARIDPQL